MQVNWAKKRVGFYCVLPLVLSRAVHKELALFRYVEIEHPRAVVTQVRKACKKHPMRFLRIPG